MTQEETTITGQEQSPGSMAGILRDHLILRDAAETFDSHEDGQSLRLAVRRLLDQQIPVIAGWPRKQDYEQVAADLASLGHRAHANLSGTRPGQRTTSRRWTRGGITGTPAGHRPSASGSYVNGRTSPAAGQ